MFEEYLARALREEVAFCSNVENIQAVEDGIYTAVTTSANNIDKLKANMERKRREREEQLRRAKDEQERQRKLAEHEKKTSHYVPQKQLDNPTLPKPTEHTNAHQTSQSTQPSGKSPLIILLIILILFAGIFLFMKMTSEDNEDNDSKLNSLLMTDILLV